MVKQPPKGSHGVHQPLWGLARRRAIEITRAYRHVRLILSKDCSAVNGQTNELLQLDHLIFLHSSFKASQKIEKCAF